MSGERYWPWRLMTGWLWVVVGTCVGRQHPMHEIIGGGGRSYLTAGGGSGGKPIGTVSVTAEGGTATIASLGSYEMKSGWKR
jgi:hypothetical protein